MKSGTRGGHLCALVQSHLVEISEISMKISFLVPFIFLSLQRLNSEVDAISRTGGVRYM